jgi:hypothetical protein
MVDKGDDEKFKGFENDQKSFSKCVFWVDLYEGVVGLHFMREYPNYKELQKTTTVPLMLQGGSCEGGLWFFMKQSLGKLIYVVFLFLCFVKLKDGVRNTGLCSLSKLKDLCYQV